MIYEAAFAAKRNVNPAWEGWPACPCGCGVEGVKLSEKTGHVVKTCLCKPCIGRRNQKAGKRTEAKRHRALGGQGFTPHDELGTSYSINVTTQDKYGKQVPQNFVTFAGLEWTRHAFSQVERVVPVGSDAMPSLWLHLPGGAEYLLVKIPKKGLRA